MAAALRRAVADPLPAAVVGDGRSVVVAVAHEHLGAAAAVLERVGQRLLDDAVGGEVDAGGQLAALALDAQLDRQPRRARALDERAEPVQRRLRRELGEVLAGVQHAEQAAHLAQRLAAGALDQRGRLDGARRGRGRGCGARRRPG